MRIERRQVETSEELLTLVNESLEAEVSGYRVIATAPTTPGSIEAAMLIAEDGGRLSIVCATDKGGDQLILKYGNLLGWFKDISSEIAHKHEDIDWMKNPGFIMMAGDFSPEALMLIRLIDVSPKRCYTFRCLGLGDQKGLYLEQISVVGEAISARPEKQLGLLTRAVDGVITIAPELSVSASFGYVGESMDWMPVANVRKRGKAVWVESGPGKWSTLRVEDDTSLEMALEKIRNSYEEVRRTRGPDPDNDFNLSEAERKSLKWEYDS